MFSDDAYSETWVLSVPSFRWIKISSSNYTGSNTEALSGNNRGRHQHKCAVHNNSQMIVLGGIVNENGTESDHVCDSQLPPLRILNLATMTWQKSFDASAEYSVPEEVSNVIGGEYVFPPLFVNTTKAQERAWMLIFNQQRLRRRNNQATRRRLQRHGRRLHLRHHRRPHCVDRLVHLLRYVFQHKFVFFVGVVEYRRHRWGCRRRCCGSRADRPYCVVGLAEEEEGCGKGGDCSADG